MRTVGIGAETTKTMEEQLDALKAENAELRVENENLSAENAELKAKAGK